MTDVSGESIGGYRLGRLIGEGGMGLVWEAEQVSLSRMVALKLIRAELAADPDFRTRFQKEARVAASIDHPNVVTVFDSGEVDGKLFISMALIALGTQEADGFSAMVEFTAPVFWGFLCLVGLSLFWLRWRDPQTPRPFKVPLYPLTPAVFCLACAYLTYSSIGYAISQNAIHVALFLLLSGVLALGLLHWREKQIKSD